MENLDLNINNYTIQDIEAFFKFKGNTNYKKEDVELRETELRTALLNSGHIHKRFKADLIDFLERAKDWLIIAKCPRSENKPTTLQNRPQLDPFPNTPASLIPPPRSDELTTREPVQPVYTMPSEYFAGNLNPLKTRIISKCLNVDTRFRDNIYNTKSTDFMFNLPMKFSKVVSMQLTAFEFPVSFYGISSSYGNNYLNISATQQLVEGGEIFEESKTIIIPDGNYNATDLINQINLLLAPKNPDNTPVDVNSIFNYVQFSLDISESGSGTGKVLLAPYGTLNYTIQTITLDFTLGIDGKPDIVPISTKIGYNLGFIKAKYRGANTYTSETLIEPAAIRYLYLAVDDFNNSVNNHFVSAFNKSIMNPNILGRISVKGSYFSLMMETDLKLYTEERKYFGPVDITKLRIQVFDDHGRILDTNNSNFSFCLVFKMLYDL